MAHWLETCSVKHTNEDSVTDGSPPDMLRRRLQTQCQCKQSKKKNAGIVMNI